MPPYANSEKHQPNNAEIAPLLAEYTDAVFGILQPSILPLARRAIGTEFYPSGNENEPTLALAGNSFREQLKYQEGRDLYVTDRIREWGIGAVIDSVKQQDVNILLGESLGDAYILRNLESVVEFAKAKNMDVMVGRYSGDELLAFFIPKESIEAEKLAAEFEEWNHKFFETDHPLNKELNKIARDLQEIHGQDVAMGAHIKATKLAGKRYHSDETQRERQLLGEVIDAAEGKSQPGGETDLAEGLLKNWDKNRQVKESREIGWLNEMLPPSILKLYQYAIRNGMSPPIAASYAEEATFESLYPRLMVYRMEVFREILEKFVSRLGSSDRIVITKSADPYLKWTNKYVSHAAGDHLMKETAYFFRDAHLATFQQFGSLVHLERESLIKVYERLANQAEQTEPMRILNENDFKPKAFPVSTTKIPNENDELVHAVVDKNTSNEQIWSYVDTLRYQQTLNEIALLISRCGLQGEIIKNVIAYLGVRLNRRDQILDTVEALKEQFIIDSATATQVKNAVENVLVPK